MVKAYAALEAGNTLEPYELTLGTLAHEDIEIDVEYCGICHSDISMINNDWGMSAFPLIGGHEVVGTISAMGDNVDNSKFSLGQRVGLGWHSDYCHHCHSCDDGEQNLCASAQGTIVGRHGGFAEKVRGHQSSIVALPEGMKPEVAGPLFCGGITVFNPLVQFDVAPTAKVAVIGIGGLGHMAIQMLKAWGCEVTALTSSPSKQVEAKKLGAHQTLASNDASALPDRYFDMIISTVNVDLDWMAFIGSLKPKGRLHFVGAVAAPIQLGLFPMLLKQISVSSSPVGSPSNIASMLDFCVRHDIEPEVEVFAFDQINEAIQKVVDGNIRYRAVLKW